MQGEGSGAQKISDWAVKHNDYLQNTKSTPYFICDNFFIGETRNGNAYILNEGILKKVTYKEGQIIVTTVEEAEVAMHKWMESVDQVSKDALLEYTGSHYFDINRVLLGITDGYSPLEIKKWTEKAQIVDKLLHNGPKWGNTAYRGTYVNGGNSSRIIKDAHINLAKSNVGDAFQSKSLFSTSTNQQIADNFAKARAGFDDAANYKVINQSEVNGLDLESMNIHIRFEIPNAQGTAIWKYSDIKSEMEVINKIGSSFEIVSKEVRKMSYDNFTQDLFMVIKLRPL